MQALSVGDLVEVVKWRNEGHVAIPFIVYGTICYLDPERIGVKYKDGQQEMFPRRQRLVAKVERTY